MHDVKNKKIIFSIEGKDYEHLMKFQKEHEGCLEKYPNMSCVQYEYSIITDGLGLFKTCTCCCGKSISLDADYDLIFNENDQKKEPKFQILSDDIRTKEVLEILFAMEKRPRMYFGKNVSYSAVCNFLAGYEFGTRMCQDRDENTWSRKIDGDIRNKMFKLTHEKEYSDEELFYLFFDVLREVLKDKYPNYLKENYGYPVDVLE